VYEERRGDRAPGKCSVDINRCLASVAMSMSCWDLNAMGGTCWCMEWEMEARILDKEREIQYDEFRTLRV